MSAIAPMTDQAADATERLREYAVCLVTCLEENPLEVARLCDEAGVTQQQFHDLVVRLKRCKAAQGEVYKVASKLLETRKLLADELASLEEAEETPDEAAETILQLEASVQQHVDEIEDLRAQRCEAQQRREAVFSECGCGQNWTELELR